MSTFLTDIPQRFADPRSGFYKTYGKGQTAFQSFVPAPLDSINFIVNDDTESLADEVLEHLRQKDGECKDLSNEAVTSSVRLAWNVPPLFLMINDKELNEKSLTDRGNLLKALDYGLNNLDRLPLSGRLIKDLHWIAMQGEHNEKKYPGEFRTSPIWMGSEKDSLSTAPFVPPSPDDMLTAFYQLEQYINTDDGIHPLIKASLIHYQFEVIHPFVDGNGRIGRLLVLLYLIDKGILHGCTINLSGALHIRQFLYYSGIASVEVSGTYEKWTHFFLQALAIS